MGFHTPLTKAIADSEKLQPLSRIAYYYVLITPDLAKYLLSRNMANRKLRPGRATTYAADMRREKWKETHQGIAIGTGDVLLDGQHRLTAIVLTNMPQWMWVAVYDDATTAINEPFDGVILRTNGDILAKDSDLVALARQAWNIVLCTRHLNPSIEDMRQLTEWLEPWHRDLKAKCGARANEKRSSSVVRVAVVARAMQGNSDEVLSQYRAFVLTDIDVMWKSVACLYKQCANKLSKMNGYAETSALVARTWRAFDGSKREKNFSLHGVDEAIGEVRNMLLATGFPAACYERLADARATQDSQRFGKDLDLKIKSA